MDKPGTVFYLEPLNDYAAAIVEDPANRNRACLVPGVASMPVLRIRLDQHLKSPPCLALFGRREHNDVVLNHRFSRNDQCYFNFNKDTGELLLHDISEKNDTELYEAVNLDKTWNKGLAQIWKLPRQCTVVLSYDLYNNCERRWVFKMRGAEFLLIPPRTLGQDQTRITNERLAFAGQTDSEKTYEGTLHRLITLGLQSEALTTTYMHPSSATINPHNTRFRTALEPENDKVIRYTKLRPLGSGGQGYVHKVVDMYTGACYACKIVAIKSEIPEWKIYSERAFRERVEKEVKLVRKVDHHKHIVSYSHTQGFKIGQNIEIFMPLYQGSLHDFIKRYRQQPPMPKAISEMEDVVNRMLSQILDALHFVHSQDTPIIHRDIKPANILYQGNQGDRFLLTDFGIAKVVDASRTMMGTRWYTAPEVQSGGKQTQKIDIYGLGATFVECFMSADDEAEGRAAVQHWQQWHWFLQNRMTRHAPLYSSMLADNADQRPTARWLLDRHFHQPTHTPFQTRQTNALVPVLGAPSSFTNQASSITPLTPMDWTRTVATANFQDDQPMQRRGLGQSTQPSQPSSVEDPSPKTPPRQPARPQRAGREGSARSSRSPRRRSQRGHGRKGSSQSESARVSKRTWSRRGRPNSTRQQELRVGNET